MKGAVDAAQGFRLAFRGVLFLGRHRLLWKWALLPLVVNIVVFTAAFALFVAFFSDLYALVGGWLSVAAPDVWYAWLWVAPLRLLTWMVGLLLIVAALVILYVAFLLLGTTIASPFLAVLAQRVEAIVSGQPPQEHTTLANLLASLGLSIVDELRKLLFFLSVQVALLLLGLIPPLLPVTTIAAILFTMLFLPLEYAGFAMDQRQLRFAQRRRLIWQQRWLMLGFGAAAFLTLLIPLLNFVCLPALVVGGTLLVLHLETSSPGDLRRVT